MYGKEPAIDALIPTPKKIKKQDLTPELLSLTHASECLEDRLGRDRRNSLSRCGERCVHLRDQRQRRDKHVHRRGKGFRKALIGNGNSASSLENGSWGWFRNSGRYAQRERKTAKPAFSTERVAFPVAWRMDPEIHSLEMALRNSLRMGTLRVPG